MCVSKVRNYTKHITEIIRIYFNIVFFFASWLQLIEKICVHILIVSLCIEYRCLARATYYLNYLMFLSAKHTDNIFFTYCYKKKKGRSNIKLLTFHGIQGLRALCIISAFVSFRFPKPFSILVSPKSHLRFFQRLPTGNH